MTARSDGAADSDGVQKIEADFRYSNLKRKWHAEEGKYLAHELRRAQDLNVQQEMELESLRQQLAALSQLTSHVSTYHCAKKSVGRNTYCKWLHSSHYHLHEHWKA